MWNTSVIKLYLVDESLLSREIRKVAEIVEILESEKKSIVQACKDIGISRSTYYKYKDLVRIVEVEEGEEDFSYIGDILFTTG